jgi:RNA polymerase sigma-54 factor
MFRGHQLRTSLNLNLSQRLAMTPSLLQKIELLTLNRLELSDLLNQELAENPGLEEVSQQTDGEDSEKQDEEKGKDEGEDAYDDFDYEYFFGEYLSPAPRSREWENHSELPSFELFLATPSTLNDHLNWQLRMTEMPAATCEIAEFIIGNINGDGYLRVTVEEIVESLQVSIDQVEEALRVVQDFDPIGIGGRDLQECLLLQIRAAGMEGSLVEKLVQEHLALVQARKFNDLAKELGCKLEEVALAMETLRGFSPKPGERYSSQGATYIQPDVHIYKMEGDYEIALNDDGLPKLRLSRSYRELLKQKNVSKDIKSFVRKRFRAAMELLKSVDQRQQTLYRACEAIVNRQRDFLDKGMTHLKPMLIKDVAEELGVHSSTVSRVVANKHAHTPQGVIELRKFFTSGIEGADGQSLSVVQVKETIKGIIANESKDKPFSDQRIANLLNDQGIRITRRTVAKYRDQLNIPGSRERKMAVLF